MMLSRVDPPASRAAPAVLDDSASSLFLGEIYRGMALTLKAYFDPKVTVSAAVLVGQPGAAVSHATPPPSWTLSLPR